MRLDKEQLNKLFVKNKDKTVTFIGDECVVTVCGKFETFGALSLEDGFNTLGVFNINYKGEDYGFNLPALVKLRPSSIEEGEENGEKVYKLIFKKGDTFLQSTVVVKTADLVYTLFKIFVFFGFRYKFMNENNISRIFDNFYLTGFNMDYTYSSVISAMFSELYRNPENLQLLNRLSEGDKAGKAIGLKNVSLTASTLTTKLSGSFLKENLTTAVIQNHTKQSEIEDLLRR